jgi:hypothetical protein
MQYMRPKVKLTIKPMINTTNETNHIMILVGKPGNTAKREPILTHHKLMTFALIIGFVVGSLFAVFPGLPTNIMTPKMIIHFQR